MFLYGYIMTMSTDFTPVPRHNDRHDGWTDAKQAAFIDALYDYGMVRAAAEKVGMGAASAYRLRSAPGAESFAAAWDMALRAGQASLADIAMDRAVNGVAVPVFYKGEQVGERRWYDNRLLMFMLRQTQTRRYGPRASEFDYVDEVLATEKATLERQLAVVEQARDMSDMLQEMIVNTDIDETGEHGLTSDQIDELVERRNRLDRIVKQFSPNDPDIAFTNEKSACHRALDAMPYLHDPMPPNAPQRAPWSVLHHGP